MVDRGEGGEVAQVVAGVEDGLGADLADVVEEGDALVHAGRAQFQDHAAGFDDQSVAGGELGERGAQGLEGGLRVLGAAGVDGERAALLLDPGALPGGDPVEEAGQFGAGGRDAGMRGGGVDGAGDGVPAFGAVVAEDDQVFQAGDAREAAVADRDAGRAAGDHGDGGDLRREGGERGHRVRVRAGLLGVGHDRGECAVEVERDHHAGGPREDGVQSVAAGGGRGPRQRVSGVRVREVRVAAHGSTISANGAPHSRHT